MEINQGLYPTYLLASVLLGAFLSAVYDCFRILRLGRRRLSGSGIDAVLLFWEDILFSVIAAVCVAILSYALNRGRVRWFALPALALGFAIWRMTLSRAVMAGVIRLGRLLSRILDATLGRLGRLSVKRMRLISDQVRLRRQKKATKKLLARLIKEAEQGKWT